MWWAVQLLPHCSLSPLFLSYISSARSSFLLVKTRKRFLARQVSSAGGFFFLFRFQISGPASFSLCIARPVVFLTTVEYLSLLEPSRAIYQLQTVIRAARQESMFAQQFSAAGVSWAATGVQRKSWNASLSYFIGSPIARYCLE